MQVLELKADKRETFGRKIKNLRKDGILPGNVYGKKVTSLAIQVNLKDFQKVFADAGETGLIELSVGGEKRPVLVHGLQVDPVSEELLHVDFVQVNLKEKIAAKVPVELVGKAPSEKQGIGTAVQYINEIEVESLPTDLPEKFEVDMSNLVNVDDAIFVKDLKVDKVKIQIKENEESIIVKVEAQVEEEVAPPPKETPEEGAPPSEGEEAPAEEEKPQEETKEA